MSENSFAFYDDCRDYPAFEDCKWTIRRDYPYYMEFTKFRIEERYECDADYLRIGDGTKMCGFMRPTSVFIDSTNGTTDVTFHSDRNNNYEGFEVRIVKEEGMMIL